MGTKSSICLMVSCINSGILLFLLLSDWRWCASMPGQTVALQLGVLQATLVSIGVGLTVASVIGYKSMREEAITQAVTRAENVVRSLRGRDESSDKGLGQTTTQQSAGKPEEPDPDTLRPEK